MVVSLNIAKLTKMVWKSAGVIAEVIKSAKKVIK